MGNCFSSRASESVPFSIPVNLRASPEEFETPAASLSRSGGTATFFTVKKYPVVSQTPETSTNHSALIGKDISRSQDEIIFYSKVKETPQHSNWTALYPFFIPCQGVLENFPVSTGSSISTTSLLLLNRLGASFDAARIVDLKIGTRTAVAGWKAKSTLAAWRANRLASLTNSSVQGFRLEGFDHPTESLASVLDAASVIKKNRRFTLQRLTGMDVFTYLLDRPIGPDGAAASWQLCTLTAIVDKLQDLVAAVETLPPQMWIGSSVGIVVDGTPSGGKASTEVKIFDWGRSTLAIEGETEFPNAARYWAEYKGGLRKVLIEAAVLLRTRFGGVVSDQQPLVLELWDFDVTSSDDFIGKVEIKEWPIAGELDIVNKKGQLVKDGSGRTTKLTVDVQEEGGVITVRIPSARNLPQMDFPHGTADPMVRLIAGKYRTTQNSKIIQNTLNPNWDAEFVMFKSPADVSSCSDVVKEIMACEAATVDEVRSAIGRTILS
jgi:hypothetical protein